MEARNNKKSIQQYQQPRAWPIQAALYLDHISLDYTDTTLLRLEGQAASFLEQHELHVNTIDEEE